MVGECSSIVTDSNLTLRLIILPTTQAHGRPQGGAKVDGRLPGKSKKIFFTILDIGGLLTIFSQGFCYAFLLMGGLFHQVRGIFQHVGAFLPLFPHVGEGGFGLAPPPRKFLQSPMQHAQASTLALEACLQKLKFRILVPFLTIPEK